MRGIDVSSYQGVVDWSQVKATGVEFAILKVIRRDLNPDKQFENNWNGCKAAGVLVQGVYNYSYATTVEKSVSDAEKVLQVLNGRKTFVWLDVEDTCQKNLGELLINIINAYKAKIEAAGCSFGVYTGLSFYGSYIKQYSDKVNCPFWIARYPSKASMSVSDNPDVTKKPVIVHELYGWQYASTGSVPGIVGNVDMNDYYKAIGENQTVAPVQPSQPAPQPTVPAKKADLGDVTLTYVAYTDRWWPPVTNRDNWAGAGDNFPLKALAMKVNKGSVKYRVHVKGGNWLGWITQYNTNDVKNGFAGDLKHEIDAIQAIFYTPDGYAYKYLHYMVSAEGNPHYYSEQIDDQTGNGMDGYAGEFGKSIDKLQAWIE